MSSLRSLDPAENTPILSNKSFRISQSQTPVLWKPASLKRSSLAGILLGALILCGCTGFLHFKDYKNGAVLFANDGNDFSVLQTFGIRYLPTILVVVYGTMITVVDLDVKRLEPWFKLSGSKHAGFTVSPLLCRYDTDFVLNVMVKALRHR